MKKKVMYKLLSAAMIGTTVLTIPATSMVAHAEEIDIHLVESYQPTAEELAAAEAAAREQGSTMVVVDTPLDDPDVRAAMEFNRMMAERQDAEFAANQKNNEPAPAPTPAPASTSAPAPAPSVATTSQSAEQHGIDASAQQQTNAPAVQNHNDTVPNVAEPKVSKKAAKDTKPEKSATKDVKEDARNVASNVADDTTNEDSVETSPKKDDDPKVGPVIRIFYNIGDGASAIAAAVAAAVDNAWTAIKNFFGF